MCRLKTGPSHEAMFGSFQHCLSKLGLAVNSSCSNTQTAGRALQAGQLCSGRIGFALDCSITHPSIASSDSTSASASCHLTLYFLPRKTVLWICIHTRFRECGAKLRDAQRQRHAARASRSKTSSIFAQKHISIAPSHSTNSTLPPAPRYWFKLCACSPMQQLGYLYCFDETEITAKPTLGSRQPPDSTVTC